jgi:urocanate hydratase
VGISLAGVFRGGGGCCCCCSQGSEFSSLISCFPLLYQGNSFLLEASRAGAEVHESLPSALPAKKEGAAAKKSVHIIESGFRYPSYVEDIMGDIFSLGFGPFRWVCTSGRWCLQSCVAVPLVTIDILAFSLVQCRITSLCIIVSPLLCLTSSLIAPLTCSLHPIGLEKDLLLTDKLAGSVISKLSACATSSATRMQYEDNALWIRKAHENRLVVGSQARILYSNAQGRIEIALAFNQAVASGDLAAPVVLSRDHHDVR